MTMFDASYQAVPFADLMQRGGEFVLAPVRSIQPPAPVVEDDPYARGLADGQELANTLFKTERARFQALLADALRPHTGNQEELAALIGETVLRLVEQVVGETQVDHASLERQITQAVALIGETDAARSLSLHPDDHALIAGAEWRFPLRADPAIGRGNIRIECSDGWVEHGRALGMEELRRLLKMESRA